MPQYIANTTNANQAQSVTSGGTIDNTEPLRFGYPKESGSNVDRRFAARWQPSIDLDHAKLRVDTAYMRITQDADQGTGAWVSNVHVNDGSAGDLTTTNLAFNVVDVPSGTVEWNIDSSWSTGTEYTTPDIGDLVHDWFYRSAYATADYIGIVADGGDSASGEYKSAHDGDSATASERPEVEINYTWLMAGSVAGVSNENIASIIEVNEQNIAKVSNSRADTT